MASGSTPCTPATSGATASGSTSSGRPTERGPGVTWQDVYEERAEETCLGYLPHSSEIAGAVVFFASPLAKCVTGTALPVNAGHWLPPSA